MGFVKDIVGIFVAILGIVLGNEVDGVGGAQKRSQALAKIKEILAAPGGIDWPKILVGQEDWILGLFIDMAVRLLNATGFFGKSSAPSPA